MSIAVASSTLDRNPVRQPLELLAAAETLVDRARARMRTSGLSTSDEH